MTNNRIKTLPRPEDRRRGDLERWVGCTGTGAHWRSEGFAEDVDLTAAVCVTVSPLPMPLSRPAAQPARGRVARPLLWVDPLGLLRG
jgi:hypothetical protein